MIGQSIAFQEMLKVLAKIAEYDVPVVIQGETGTGKELAARAVHYRGIRQDKPFVPVNCGAIPDLLFENELFGHRKGAFTDARDDQVGLIALADSGTLFLDEIDTLSPHGQVALLRFLQNQHYRPLGARLEQSADVRIIAATNADIAALVKAGRFREDLYYRLNILQIDLPPLRERKGDPELLAEHFIVELNKKFGKPVIPLHPDMLEWLDRYSWPGNIRELENMVCREFLLSEGPILRFFPACKGNRGCAARWPDGIDRREILDYASAKQRALQQFEVDYLSSLLAKTNGNVTAAAKLAGKERRCFGKLIKKYGIDKQSYW